MNIIESMLAAIGITYFISHLPAIIALIAGVVKWKSNRNLAKKLLMFAGVYFVIGLIVGWFLIK